MTKEFQKELNEVVKEGITPSQIKKLKKSKSTGDLPNTPKSQPLQHSKSQLEIPTAQQPNSEEQITNLKEQVKFHAETAQNYLTSLQTSQAKVSELEQKLKEKEKQLDNSLFARVEAVKQFGLIYDKLRLIRKELNENVDQASDELINQDEKISQYRTNQRKAQARIQDLEKDLQLAQRLAEMRKVPYPDDQTSWDYLKYPLYSLVLVLFTLWITNNLRNQQ